ncbi:MAG: hypothetical protein WC824_11975 [Bacteroidota bacterium]
MKWLQEDLSPLQNEQVLALFRALAKKLKDYFPTPDRASTSPDLDSFLLVWDNEKQYADIEVFPNGLMRCFWRDRPTEVFGGFMVSPGDEIPEEFIERMKRVHSVGEI